jgi:hypothetical protein
MAEELAQADALEGAGARALARGVVKRVPEALEPPLKISDEAGYEALAPGKKFIDPEGNVRTKLHAVESESDYESVPEGAQYLDPEGITRTKPAYEDIDFTAHTLYSMAVNDKERRNALERSYPGKVKQLPSGEFYVDDDGVHRKPRAFADPRAGWLTAGAKVVAGAVPTAGAITGEIAGGLGGSAIAPGPGTAAGAIGGAGVGAAVGQGFNDLVLQLAGVYDRTAGEELGELGMAGGSAVVGSGIGRVAGGVLRGAGGLPGAIKGGVGSRMVGKFLGADPEGVEMALGLAEKGVQPPLSGWAKEAPHAHNIVEVFDPAFHTQKPLLQSATAHYEKTGKEILGELGVRHEGSLSEPIEAVPTQKTGEAIMRRTLAESEAADAELRKALDARRAAIQAGAPGNLAQREAINQAAEQSRQAAQRLINQGFTEIEQAANAAARVSGAGHNGGDLWDMVGARLMAVKRGLQERASVMYRQADELAGGYLPNTEGLPEIAEQFANQLPEEFQRNQPGIVRQLRAMAGERDPQTGEWIREPVPPTFGQLHNLRSQFRSNADWYRLNSDIKNGTYKFFARRVDEALRDVESVPELAPAVEQLNRADRFYRENMPVFEAQQIKAVMRGLESGEPADPQRLFDVVVKEGHTDLTNRIRQMVGSNLWAGVQAADLQQMLRASQSLVPGEIDGRAFVREVLERQRSGILQSVHDRDVTARLIAQAQNVAMMEGRLPLTVRPGDTLTDVIGRARAAADAAREAARQDPLKTLKTEMQRVEREHAQQVAKMRAERKNDPLGFLYDPTTGAAEAVNKILTNEDLIIAAAARFGENSPEFQMLRQVYAQRILQGTLEPGARLAKISPEAQALMFPPVTLDQMRLLAKEMDFLMSSRGVQDTAKSMAAVSKVEHPWASILGRGGALAQVLTAPTKVIPGADFVGRSLLGGYYGLVRKLTTSPAFLRWIEKGLKGNQTARNVVREQVQRAMQVGGAVGAGAAEGTFQASEQTPQELEAPQFENASSQLSSQVPQFDEDSFQSERPNLQEVDTLSQPSGPERQPTWKGRFPDDADLSQDPFERAAARQRRAVFGREAGEGQELANQLMSMTPPGAALNAVQAYREGDTRAATLYGAGAVAPVAGKAVGMLPHAAKVAGAGAAALAALLNPTEAGKVVLDPEQRQKLMMEQERLKQKQENARQEAEIRKQEADAKAARDAQAARDAAQNEAELKKELARIEAEKEKTRLEIENQRHLDEEAASARAVAAAAAENKRLHERPFREKHPEAALAMTLGGMAIAGAIPGVSNALKAGRLNKYIKDLERLDADAVKALNAGTAEQKQVAVNRLAAAIEKLPEREAVLTKGTPVSTKLAVGLAGAEGAALPAEIDYGTQPPGSEARKQAEEFFGDPREMARVLATYLGGTMAGATASKIPFKIREAPAGSAGLIKSYEKSIADAKEAAEKAEKAEKAAARARKAAETRARKAAEGESTRKRPAVVDKSAQELLSELGIKRK